eukprot:gene22805-27552_t
MTASPPGVMAVKAPQAATAALPWTYGLSCGAGGVGCVSPAAGSSQRVPPGEQPPPLGGLQGSSLPQKELKGALRQLLSSDTSGSVEGSHKDGSRTPTVRVPSAEMYPPEGGLSRRDPSNWRSDIAAPVGSVGPGRGGHKQPPAGEGESRAREVEAVVRPSGTSGGPGSRRSQSARQVAEEADDSIPSPHRANQGYSQGPISDALGWKSEALAEETELVEWQRARGSWADGRMQGGGEKGMAEDEGWRKRPSQHAKSPPDLGHLDQSSAELEEHSPQPSQGVEASSRLAGRQGGRGGSGAHGVGSSPGCQNLNDGTQSGGQSRIPSAPVCVPSSSPARPQGSPQRMPRFPTHSAVHLRTVEWQSPLRGRGTRRSGVDGAGSVQEWPVEIAMGSGGSVGSRRVAHGQDGEGYKGREGYRREGCGEVTEAEGADVEGGEKEKQAVGVVDAEGWAGGAEGEERQGAEAEEKADGLRGSSMQELGKRKPSGITARGTMAEASHLRRSSLGRHGSGGREGHAGTAAAGGSSTDRVTTEKHAGREGFPGGGNAGDERDQAGWEGCACEQALVAKAEELRNTDQTLVAASLIADPTLPTVIHDDTTTSLREPDPTGPIQWSPRHEAEGTTERPPEAEHPAHPALVHLLHTPRVPSTVEEAAVRVASPADLAGCASEPHFGLSAPPPHGACDDTLRPSTSEPQICLNQSKLRDPEERPEKQASHHDGAEERRRHRALSEDCSEAADDTWQEVMTDDALNDSEDGSPRLRGLSARDHPKGGAGRGGDPWHCLKHVVMYPLRKARQERRANRTKWGVQ